MFEQKKTLIVVYKDELLMNQLRKLVETNDDKNAGVVGTRDNSISIVSWTEKVWLSNKKAGNIQGKILFLGDVKGTDELIPVIDVQFDDCGVKYGWAGNQAVLFVEPKTLTDRAGYDAFLEKLDKLPVPDFLKTTIMPVTDSKLESKEQTKATTEPDSENKVNHKWQALLDAAKRTMDAGADGLGKVRDQVADKAEEVFRNKKLMKQQMLFYGVVNLYNNGLERFMNQ